MAQTSISSEDAGERLDRFLTKFLGGVSRRHARRYLTQGLVSVNGRNQKDGYLLREGDYVEVTAQLDTPSARPEKFISEGHSFGDYFEVVEEDERFLCLSKRRGISCVVHELDDPMTLADALAAYRSECLNASPDPRESGLVQRLDRWTSGLILAAKDRKIWEELRNQLFESRIAKTYIALVEGTFTPVNRTIGWPLEQSASGKKMEVVRATGPKTRESSIRPLACETHVTRLKTFPFRDLGASFVRCRVDRAQRHQIRAHLASTTFPLVGDDLYGSELDLHWIHSDLKGEQYQAFEQLHCAGSGFYLHAETLTINLPWRSEPTTFTDSSKLLEAFQAHS